jgi:SOUL heme-binding protein
MKVFLIVIFSLTIVITGLSAWFYMETSDIEHYGYDVIATLDEVEIRAYKPAVFSTVTLADSTYKNSSSTGFRTLAGYIFGGNDRGEEIAMTSPVMMEMNSQVTMSFMVPSGRSIESLPKPNNSQIQFVEKPAITMAAIRFGGWASDEKIEKFKKKLEAELNEQGIKHTNKFAYLGYNPPFQFVNRRNEVVVEIVDWKKP